MSEQGKSEFEAELAERIKKDLIEQHGILLFGKALYQILGFNTADAFRHAQRSGRLPIKVFSLKNKRGRYALAEDVANWLAASRAEVECVDSKEKHKS